MREKSIKAPSRALNASRAIARFIRYIVKWAIFVILLYQLWFLGHVLWWNWENPTETSFMSLRLSAMRIKTPRAQLKFKWVPYNQISSSLKRAVVAAEDDKFVDHDGFDWDGMAQAMKKNQKKGKTVSGGSTISQQLSKNLLLSPTRSYLRKIEEAIITVMIESIWSKKRILEVYLNVAEWGDGIFGAEAAAQHYYGIAASKLNEEQAAHLAVMLPNPHKYEKNYSQRLRVHAQKIQNRMKFSEIP